jgi:hypothetical protein
MTRPMDIRSATLHGTLEGPIWQPGVTAQLSLTIDLRRTAARIVNGRGSGLVDAITLAIDEGSGDFQHAKLTADSFVSIVHVRGAYSGRSVSRERTVNVTELPSLAAYVDPEAWTYSDDE